MRNQSGGLVALLLRSQPQLAVPAFSASLDQEILVSIF